MFKHPFAVLLSLVSLLPFVTGCSQTPDLPPVTGSEGEAAARAAFEQTLQALESGNQDKVWEGLSTRSQTRIKRGAKEGVADKSEAGSKDKAKAIETLRKMLGRNPQIKAVRGTRSGVQIEYEYTAGKTRDLEMVLENGAWKLNLFSS